MANPDWTDPADWESGKQGCTCNMFKRVGVHDEHCPALMPEASEADMEPDWEGECENCGASPIVPLTGLCGPCTFGEADTVGGNW